MVNKCCSDSEIIAVHEYGSLLLEALSVFTGILQASADRHRRARCA